MTEIKNTTRAMREDPAEPLLALAEGMATGSAASFIEGQERAGQQQLVNSDRLPTDRHGEDEFLALGFTFGDPDPRDPMFCPATLPAGWKREGSDHAMWSYITDEHRRRRVAIFYKAAFYDRSAFMRSESLSSYVSNIVEGYTQGPVVFDETWATQDAVREVLTGRRGECLEKITFWTEHRNDEYVRDYTARAARYEQALSGMRAK